MPAIPRRVSAGTALAAVLLITSSCTGLDQASASGVTRQDLAAEMAGQLAEPSVPAYTATYRLAGGAKGRTVQTSDPARTAHVFPTGRLINTAAAVTLCTRPAATPGSSEPSQPVGETVCTATDPRRSGGLPATTGMIEPDAVAAMLETAAIDPAVEIEQQDTTLAGRNAACLRVRGADDFDTCVTVAGVLASFTGHVDGTAVEMVLVDYAEETDEADFAAPLGARFVDRRSK
ncbi:hypothetical protein [Actinoplanes aureus]|uniref:Lipoprotein n=1 Tax=Actinoplanes aureus TaxID=2792083 RepID=A0A931C9X1_9ACTN|nr:hypothetical protein [Actinoplanes aureus]MBG0563213.1 hypothetical protein [Actinoplanes aureus]